MGGVGSWGFQIVLLQKDMTSLSLSFTKKRLSFGKNVDIVQLNKKLILRVLFLFFPVASLVTKMHFWTRG